MFDGAFRATRKVNMSGGRRPPFASSSSSAFSASSSSSSSKEQLVLHAKRAREERYEQRRRAAACTRIQALYRRLAAAARARTTVFCALEAELTRLVATTDIRATALPAHTLAGFLRQFWFAFGRDVRKNLAGGGSESVDADAPWVGMAGGVARQRVLNVQNYLVFMLLVSCLRAQPPETSFLAAPKDAAWLYQVTRLLEVSLRMLTSTRFATPLEQATNPYLLLLGTFASTDRFPSTASDSAAAFSALMYKLAARAQYGSFHALGDVLRAHALRRTSAANVEGDRVVQVVSSIAAIALRLQRGDQQDEVSRAFARKMLLTPSSVSSPAGRYVLSQVTPRGDGARETHESITFWREMVGHLRGEELTWDERAVALGNVVDLLQVHAFERSLVQSACQVMASLISSSMVQWAFGIHEPRDVEMKDAASAPAPAQVLNRDSGADLEAEAGILALGAFEPIVRAQIEQLCDASFGRRCLDGVVGSLEHAGSVDAFGGFCDTYAVVLLGADRAHLLTTKSSFAPPTKPVFSFLSGVVADQVGSEGSRAEAASIMDRTWVLLDGALRAEKSKYTGSASVMMYPASRLNMLLVFNTIYSHLLLGLDDETFYDREWPLKLAHVTSVVSFLKTFIYDTCWNVASGSTLPSSSRARYSAGAAASAAAAANEATLFAAVTTSVKLFNHLYDRDCRRRFTADGAWLWPAMPVIKETVDLESMEDDDQQDTQALRALMGGVAVNSQHARAALVLATIPQVFAFNDRVQLFEKLLDDEKAQLGHMRSEFAGAIQVRIKRDEIVDQSFDFFQHVCETKSPAVLKSKIKVTFINEQGLEEAGIDGGGVFKEYVDALTKSAFSPEFGSFLATQEQLLYPNPAARFLEDSRKEVHDRFRFLGLVLAKAVYENILVEPQFAAFFLNKLLGKFNYIDDLHSLDPELYKNLMQLKHYKGDVEDLALTFSVSEMEFGEVVTRNLIPDGANIPVTNANRIRYIHVMANYKLNVLSSSESAAFLKGFRDLIPAKWIQMFSPSELQMLIGGSASNIDVDDWERHTAYGGGYHPSQVTVQWFWDIVRNDFDMEERAALLKFITSCSRQPLLGFGQLTPQICVHQVRTTEDERLPSSATCMNLLKLPTYSSKEIMRKKLLYAIKANAGFDLS